MKTTSILDFNQLSCLITKGKETCTTQQSFFPGNQDTVKFGVSKFAIQHVCIYVDAILCSLCH